MRDKILESCIESWNITFGGISAIKVSEELDLNHKQVREIFREFTKEGKGSINEDAELYNVSLDPEKPGSMSTEKVITTIFFPSKEVLRDHYYNSDLASKNHPEYEKRLYIGHSQIELCFFNISVLKKYQDHPEKYDLNDTVSGGHLGTDYDYSEKIDDSEYIPRFNFGKKKVNNGNLAVVAFLKDLSRLPKKEQSYWLAHELESPAFDSHDRDFHKFYLRYFEGIPTDYENPIDKLFEILSGINQLLIEKSFGKLFTKLSNPYLAYPVNNTKKHFSDSLSEFYKIIGPDGSRKKTLKNILKNEFDLSDSDFINKDSGRKFSTSQLFTLLIENLDINREGLEVITEVKNHRIAADHKVMQPESSGINYIGEFRRLIEKLNDFYAKVKNELTKRLNAT